MEKENSSKKKLTSVKEDAIKQIKEEATDVTKTASDHKDGRNRRSLLKMVGHRRSSTL